MTADLSRVNQWFRDTLAGDNQLNTAVGGRIYVDQAPQNAHTPMVIYAYLGGVDKIVSRASRLTNALYLVRAITQGSSYDAIEAIADRIDELLVVPDVGEIVRDVRIVSVGREQPHQRKDNENGIAFVYSGGFYRVRFQPAGF